MPELEIEVPQPVRLERGPDGKVHLLQGREPEPLTAEQSERIARAEAVRAENLREWEAMLPEERAAEEAAWEQVMRNINERQRRSRGIADDEAGLGHV